MSLGIAFKGPEGIVLAADSRVTINAEQRQNNSRIILPATFDNATKLLKFTNLKHVGVVTYGLGVLGQKQFRTAHSFLPEFEDELGDTERLGVQDFSKRLSDFFMKQWKALMPSAVEPQDNMFFLVGGYNKGEPYGRLFQFAIPSDPTPFEQNKGEFGLVWGGQAQIVYRLLNGFDPKLPHLVQQHLKLTDGDREGLREFVRKHLGMAIPYPFLPLQDCVDLSVLLIRTTIELQSFMVGGVRGVGGAIDVATITRTDGFKAIQQKTIEGERKRG